MNREVLKAIDTNVIPISRLAALFDTFGLRHSSKVLPELLEAAEQGNASYKQLLLSIFETEVKGRNARRRKRNYAAAHFPPNIQPLEMFNSLELESGITQAQLNRLKELNWLDNKGNLVFAEPPGLGKTMVACGLGLEAINCGYTVCFEKMVNLIVTRTFFQQTIPEELREAAELDGCGDTSFFIRVVLPLSSSIIAVMVLFYAVSHWNSYYNALLYLSATAKYPLQLVLHNILIVNTLDDMVNDVATQAAQQRMGDLVKYGMIIVSSLPLLILYPFLQKYFVHAS